MRRRRANNPELVRAKEREYRKNNPDVVRQMGFKYNYGITLADYNEMVAKQEGLCAACKCHPNKLVVDHCHATGKVRALLCGPCNIAIGICKESPAILDMLKVYLNDFAAVVE